ncbi:MAG: hypothetical protein NQ127_03915 [Candidatus Cardinium sp.]|nr:hypothetical protein [Candidatus Cardinium sp.]
MLPNYTLEEFHTLIEAKSSHTFIQKLKNRASQWHTTGTEPDPYEIWKHYREEIESNSHALKEERAIQNFFDCWGNFIQNPTDSNEKKVIEAKQKLEADLKVKERFEKAAAIYSQPEKFILTKAAVDYYRYLRFMLDKPANTLDRLLDCLEKVHEVLKVWKKKNPMGVALWQKVCSQCADELKECKYFQYDENKNAIAKGLTLIDGLAKDPYGMRWHALGEELPHALWLLGEILDVLENKISLPLKKDALQTFKTYCKITQRSAMLEAIVPDL